MHKFFILYACILFVCAGCETSSDTSYVTADEATSGAAPTTDSPGDTPDSPSPEPTSGGFSYDSVVWGGESYGGASVVDMTLSSASVDGSFIYFTYDMNDSWPLHSLGDGNVQAVACMFMKRGDGSWYGGKFDWIAVGGQSVKLTENINNGYGAFASEKPSSGQTVAFIWVSTDKKRRSTEAITTW